MSDGSSEARSQARILRWSATIIAISLMGLLLPSKLYWFCGVLLVAFIMRLLARRAS